MNALPTSSVQKIYLTRFPNGNRQISAALWPGVAEYSHALPDRAGAIGG
jgi:hypothetical protein